MEPTYLNEVPISSSVAVVRIAAIDKISDAFPTSSTANRWLDINWTTVLVAEPKLVSAAVASCSTVGKAVICCSTS